MMFEREVFEVCRRALECLGAEDLKFKPMKKERRVDPKRGFVIGRTNLRTKSLSIDIYTPLKREPKKMSSILRTLCHEVAHHQRPPFRQRHKGRWIFRQHYPEFYSQVNENILKLKTSEPFKKYFPKGGDRCRTRSAKTFWSRRILSKIALVKRKS